MPSDLRPIRSGELPIDTRALARALIGCVVVRDADEGRTAGRIVETEAYPLRDPACHARTGRSERNATLFGPPHRAYVYQIYGTSFCFNLASEADGDGAGVLVRALEPLEGLAIMQARRGRARDLCRGPGRVCAALGIDRGHDGSDLFEGGALWLAAPVARPGRIRTSPRIGITRWTERRLRYYEAGNPHVSGPRFLSPS